MVNGKLLSSWASLLAYLVLYSLKSIPSTVWPCEQLGVEEQDW